MTEFEEWYVEQPQEFKEYISSGEIPTEFVDKNFKPITLDELKELDKKFC